MHYNTISVQLCNNYAHMTETRDLILDATERLLARYGYRKMSIDDIAHEAGIGRRTIYLHFSSKEEVALCSIDRVVERLLAELRNIARTTEPPEERLRKMLVTRVLFRFDSVHDYHGSLDDLFEAVRPAYMIRREKYFAEEASLFADVLADGQSKGAFTESSAGQSATTLLLATNGLLPYSLSTKELGKRADVEERAIRIANMLIDGLRAREGRR
jgi:AcrR family transcriptional regulator